jgi:hypothetical protein
LAQQRLFQEESDEDSNYGEVMSMIEEDGTKLTLGDYFKTIYERTTMMDEGSFFQRRQRAGTLAATTFRPLEVDMEVEGYIEK